MDNHDQALVDRLIIRCVTKALDELVGACIDCNGKARSPTMREINNARSWLPPQFKNTFHKTVNELSAPAMTGTTAETQSHSTAPIQSCP